MSQQYLIDTNICIYLLKRQYGIAERLNKVGRANCFISDVTLAELYYGASLPIHEVLEKFGDSKALLKSNGSW